MTTALQQRWQPANATLVIVGRVDPVAARKFVMTYFGGWAPAAGVAAQKVPPVPAPNAAKAQAIYVFDDPGKTQTQVTLTCPLKPAVEQPSPVHEVLGDIASMTLFSELREKAGVVYSPGAGVRIDPSGAATMFMTAAIQNDSAVFALQHYLRFLEKASDGQLSETDLRVKKLSRASGYVVDQQNIDQMYGNRLQPTIARRQPWSSFDRYADSLAGITLDQLADISHGCDEHAFVTFKGPKEKVAAQLDAAGQKYEIVDVEKVYGDWYGKADPKGYARYVKQKAKDDAKKAKEEAEKKADDTTDDGSEAEAPAKAH
jgi:predicted Zn-dependent peptidase